MYHKWKLWCMVSEIWSVTDRIFLEFFLILGHFLPFYLTNNLKNENFEKMKKKYDVCFLRYGPWQNNFLFPMTAQTTKIKKWNWRYHSTHVYLKLLSHDVWFLRYGVQWTDAYQQIYKVFITIFDTFNWKWIHHHRLILFCWINL